MPIGTSDGEYFDNQFEAMVGSGVTAGLRRIPIVKDPEVIPGENPGDYGMVVNPNAMMLGKELDQIEVDPTTGLGLEVNSRMPLGSPREPAGALKQEEATTLRPPNSDGLSPNVDWSRMNQPTGSVGMTDVGDSPLDRELIDFRRRAAEPTIALKDAPPEAMQTAIDVAMGFGAGTIGKISNKAYIDMFVNKAKAKPSTMWEWEGIKLDTAKLSDKQFKDFERTVNNYNKGKMTQEAFQREAKEYEQYVAAGGYKGKKVDPLEQIPFGYSEGEWALMSPFQKKQVLKGPVDETEKILAEIAKVLDAESGVKKIPITEFGKIEKLSPKEAFKQGFEIAKDQLTNDLNLIAAKFKKAIVGPPAEIPPPKVSGKGDYTEPAYRGLSVYDQPGMVTNPVYKFTAEGAMYSTAHPMLADMYAGYLNHHPGMKVPEGTFPQGAQVMPLLINTKDYHYFDAKGAIWQEANPKAIIAAKDMGKKGVIVDNVWDEPNSTKALAKPNKVYITFPKGAGTVKSRFAEKFDESSPNIMHGIATVGIGTAATGYIATEEQPPNL